MYTQLESLEIFYYVFKLKNIKQKCVYNSLNSGIYLQIGFPSWKSYMCVYIYIYMFSSPHMSLLLYSSKPMSCSTLSSDSIHIFPGLINRRKASKCLCSNVSGMKTE